MDPVQKEQILRELKKQEPGTSIFFRAAIIAYEWGDVEKCLVRTVQDPENRRLYIAESKLHIADLITMIHVLCIELGLNFTELEELGIEHLKERYTEFKTKGWVELK